MAYKTPSLDCTSKDLMKIYLDSIRRYKILSQEETNKLINNTRNSDNKEFYKQKLIEHNLRWVVSRAKLIRNRYRYDSNKIDFLDLIQAGNIGLIRAAELCSNGHYDPKRSMFTTFSALWIDQFIIRYISDSNLIRIPVHQHENISKYKRAYWELCLSGKEPSDKAIAKKTNLTSEQIKDLKYSSQIKIDSLEMPIYRDRLLEEIVSSNLASPEQLHYDSLKKDKIKKFLQYLEPVQAKILKYHYGLHDHPLTLKDIGNIMGITKQRVYQIEQIAIKKLKKKLGISSYFAKV